MRNLLYSSGRHLYSLSVKSRVLRRLGLREVNGTVEASWRRCDDEKATAASDKQEMAAVLVPARRESHELWLGLAPRHSLTSEEER